MPKKGPYRSPEQRAKSGKMVKETERVHREYFSKGKSESKKSKKETGKKLLHNTIKASIEAGKKERAPAVERAKRREEKKKDSSVKVPKGGRVEIK